MKPAWLTPDFVPTKQAIWGRSPLATVQDGRGRVSREFQASQGAQEPVKKGGAGLGIERGGPGLEIEGGPGLRRKREGVGNIKERKIETERSQRLGLNTPRMNIG